MKRYLITLGLLFFFTNTTFATPETFKFDSNHSFVTWHISHFGFSNPSGKWSFSGDVILDETNPKNSKVNAIINVANPITGIPKFDEHLKSKDFFDVKKYPKATFVSDKVDITGTNQAEVHGILTLHGVSKPVTLNVTLIKLGLQDYSHKKTAGFSATTTLKRSDFGMTSYLPGVGDEVQIQIDSEGAIE